MKMKVGLALSSGGPRGLAHIGVIKALEENNIPIDMIAGTSAGSLIGGLYAATLDIKAIEEISTNLKQNDLLKIFADIGFPTGLIRGKNIEPFLEQVLRNQNFNDLKIPFTAIATELSTGRQISINEGNVAAGIHASCAIPGLFEGVLYQNKYLVDGAIACPVPVKVVKKMGATITIAVNLNVYHFSQFEPINNNKPNISDTGIAALNMLISNLSKVESRKADVIINPDVTSISSFNMLHFTKGSEIINKGYESAKKMMPEILDRIDKSYYHDSI
jgi:NTE family protein